MRENSAQKLVRILFAVNEVVQKDHACTPHYKPDLLNGAPICASIGAGPFDLPDDARFWREISEVLRAEGLDQEAFLAEGRGRCSSTDLRWLLDWVASRL